MCISKGWESIVTIYLSLRFCLSYMSTALHFERILNYSHSSAFHVTACYALIFCNLSLKDNYVWPQGAFMRKVSNYVAKVGRSDQDLNMVSLWFQGSFALAILTQMVDAEE